ncbi:MAG: ADP-heptose--LPS heptosyltransferase [Acidobacteriota bacterium]|nr:ADP-heptose--LPS heptosyltransferase [Acidobacteriota bacterium]
MPEALRNFERAELLGHDPDECAAQRWYCWMLLGDLERAWQEGDAIAARGAPDPNRLWDGLPLDNKRVIIRCLHGYGDAIQFLRYAALVRGRASRVIVETHLEMVPLLSGLAGVDEVITWGDGSSAGFSAWDSQIEVMELPRIFRTTLETIPWRRPYLSVTAATKQESARNLPSHGLPRVGVLWTSSNWNEERSIPFPEFSRILQVPGFSFFSFQRGPARRDLRSLVDTACHDTAEHSPGIHDTAADLANMDLLITVDTMAAHLAGALGTPVWTLLPYRADWRWMLQREDTPWYPTMRLLRQTEPGNWSPVIDRVVRDLIGLPRTS